MTLPVYLQYRFSCLAFLLAIINFQGVCSVPERKKSQTMCAYTFLRKENGCVLLNQVLRQCLGRTFIKIYVASDCSIR